MSIRTTFNPLGTLGGELPYVQPVMVSNTEWTASCNPSFGMTISYNYYPKSAPDTYAKGFWKAFGAGTYVMLPYTRLLTFLNFEKPVKVNSISFEAGTVRGGKAFMYSTYDGPRVTVTGGSGSLITYEMKISNPVYNNTFVIITEMASNEQLVLRNMQLTAYYKP